MFSRDSLRESVWRCFKYSREHSYKYLDPFPPKYLCRNVSDYTYLYRAIIQKRMIHKFCNICPSQELPGISDYRSCGYGSKKLESKVHVQPTTMTSMHNTIMFWSIQNKHLMTCIVRLLDIVRQWTYLSGRKEMKVTVTLSNSHAKILCVETAEWID